MSSGFFWELAHAFTTHPKKHETELTSCAALASEFVTAEIQWRIQIHKD